MKRMTCICLSLAAIFLVSGRSFAQNTSAEEQAEIKKIVNIERSLVKRTGDVSVANAEAVLHLGNQFYFIDAASAKTVLVDGWGNSAADVSDVLGMVFPVGVEFYTRGAWGAVVTYRASGYVEDKTPKPDEYDDLIKRMKEGEESENAQRQKDGLAPVHLIGWAQAPTYDKTRHVMIWARDIKFGSQTDDTLNYDLRALGRNGVLSLNMVSSMSNLPQIRQDAAKLTLTPEFSPGHRYADFKEGDPLAGYGLVGLVGAGLGLAAAKKLGLLALALAFGKKFIALIVGGFAAAMAAFKKRFGKSTPTPSVIPPAPKDPEPAAPTPPTE